MSRLMDQKSNNESTEYWNKECKERVIDRLRAIDPSFDAETIYRIIGVLETNAYEIHGNGQSGYRGLFPLSSLMSHGCVANSNHRFSIAPPYALACRASVDIKEGDEIFSSYVKITKPTIQRRQILKDCWHFDCECVRCQDPTEMGSYVCAILCQNCKLLRNPETCADLDEKWGKDGYLIPTNPLDHSSPWRCSRCGCQEKQPDYFVENFLGKRD